MSPNRIKALYLDEIDLVERIVSSRFLNIENGDDVLVVKVSEELHLSKSSQAEHGVVKRSNLLDGDLLSGGLVDGRAMIMRLDWRFMHDLSWFARESNRELGSS